MPSKPWLNSMESYRSSFWKYYLALTLHPLLLRNERQNEFLSLTSFPEIVLTKNEWFYIFRDMSDHEEKKIEEFAEMFKALSNPNRLKIFLRLISCCQPGTIWNLQNGSESEGCACVGDLSQDLNIVSSTISHHIKELRHAGLIRMKRKGQRVECSIDPEAIAALKGFFMQGK